jgi:putative phosphoesterase
MEEVVTVRLLLISDTHVPKRARDLPRQVWDEVAVADVVVHAGDWADVTLLDLLESRARRVIGVAGNNDGSEFTGRLSEEVHVELAGVRFTVVHDTGPTQGREARCMERFPRTDVLVFGHSHIPWDTVAENGMRLLNPGSPTDRRRQPSHTYMTTKILDGRLGPVLLHSVQNA